jgi:hypothetical protein
VDGFVSLPITQKATIHLLNNVRNGMSFDDALTTREKVGRDPSNDAKLALLKREGPSLQSSGRIPALH